MAESRVTREPIGPGESAERGEPGMPGEPGAPGKGTLYVVATPIGNLGDITLRALETLKRVPVIAAEDTRHTRKLLTHFGVRARLVSYHAHNRQARTTALLAALEQGDVALVTDAGTPVVSDPGQELVRDAAAVGHPVVVVPGPSALTAALAVSGLDVAAVHFIGFLPRRVSERRRALSEVASWPGVLVCFEAPHRLRATLEDVLTTLGDVRTAICCELTKLFEHVLRGPVSEALAHYEAHPPRGEFTLVIELPGMSHTATGVGVAGSASREGAAPGMPGDVERQTLEERFEVLVQQHGDRKAALAALARETGRPRKALYARLIAGRPHVS